MAVPGIHDSMREFRLEVIPFNNRRDLTPAKIQKACAKQHPDTRHRLDRSPPIMARLGDVFRQSVRTGPAIYNVGYGFAARTRR